MSSMRIWVSGANGHLGYNLVRALVERGHSVRASVRDLDDTRKTGPLRALEVEVVRADLEDPSSLASAARGMDGVIHAAATFDTGAADPKAMLDRPNVDGTRHVLEACASAGVGRVVLTSSIAAVGTIRPGEAPLDESSWNERAIEPYARSKRDSERLAWAVAEERGLSLVTILPGTMLGPGFQRHTPSTSIVEMARRGRMMFAPPVNFSFVDVRDVADAHVLALERPEAKGRYIASGPTRTLREITDDLHEIEPRIPRPLLELPSFMLGMLPVLDWLEHRLAGAPRRITRALIEEYGRRTQALSSAKLTRELGWKTRPLRATLADTLEWMDALG